MCLSYIREDPAKSENESSSDIILFILTLYIILRHVPKKVRHAPMSEC